MVQRRKPLTVKRASGRALQTSISYCLMVMVPPLNGKLPELSGRWMSFQLTFISYLASGARNYIPLHIPREGNARVAGRLLGGFSGEFLGVTTM